jgi:hypothetical protein
MQMSTVLLLCGGEENVLLLFDDASQRVYLNKQSSRTAQMMMNIAKCLSRVLSSPPLCATVQCVCERACKWMGPGDSWLRDGTFLPSRQPPGHRQSETRKANAKLCIWALILQRRIHAAVRRQVPAEHWRTKGLSACLIDDFVII